MSKNHSVRATARRLALACAFVAAAAACASAQTSPASQPSPMPQATPSPSPQAQPSPAPPESHFFGNILRDQRAIWTSPFHLGHGDAKWIVPLGISSAVLFATDRRTARELFDEGENESRVRVSKDISYGGSLYATGGTVAAFYLFGRAAHNARARETGVLGAEALLDSEIVVNALKGASLRQRPRTDNASGEFFDGGSSFPSGHAASAWSVATVVAEEYGHDRPLVRFGVYGIAAAVSVSRFTARKHFLSDVLVGSAIGYGVGRYVYRTHHDPNLDGDETSSARRSKLFPAAVAPQFASERGRRAYGLRLAWEF